ncbi:TlpA family protein disulfide reductase [Luteolibacter ambystomatis]|uniref:TlpA family protein disulfide reductase n=1 Tax=Luteolibacter ambystomatis TaxID=2824561 RepID=A0A975G8S5_9BACT|nr:TlpA disulfide reductase family protein [Luteolibacter ambystomatis]QUE50395.1 TlpA family protein disulfide reductase [Luteolibacter ambystomatis]
MKWSSVLLAAALAVSFQARAEEPKAAEPKPAPAAKKIWAEAYLGKKAPELKVEKWLTEKPATEGKFVMIDFWATWCGPCRKAIPELNKFQEKFRDKLVVIGISDEEEAKVKPFSEKEIRYSSAIDTKGETKKAMKVSGIPHVILLNPKGVVVWEGFPLLDGYELTEDVVKRLLEAKVE